MKAAAFYEYGPPEAMQYADIPDPVIGPRDVLIRVQACGVNHSDLDSRAGTSRWSFRLPMVLGAEFTGTVVGAGPEAGPVQPGDLVTAFQQYSCGRCAQCAKWRPDLCAAFEIFGTTRWGGYGELVSVPAEVVIPLQPSDDPLAMAAGQCAVSTAWHMVNRLGLIRPGELVLVPSASGGVAGALVQCAKLAGATVVATVGTSAKAELVAPLGADLVLVRGDGDLATELLRSDQRPPFRRGPRHRRRHAVRRAPVRAARRRPADHLRRARRRGGPARPGPAVPERLAHRRLPAGAPR